MWDVVGAAPAATDAEKNARTEPMNDRVSPQPSALSPRAATLIAVIVIAALVAFAYEPGLHAFWTRDDYMQLAFARLVGSPWPLFIHDHYFPAPGSIFRPLGFASFWLWQALFGTNYFAHACGDLALHVGVALALYRVLRAGAIDRVLATACTLLFALHPVAIGTALWWSARFDLLATLFGLVAIGAAIDRAKRPRQASLAITLVALLAALASKETALASACAVGGIWFRAAAHDAATRRRHVVAMGVLAAVVIVFFAWRALVLGTVSTGLIGDASLVDAVLRGFGTWWENFDSYGAFVAQPGPIHAALVAAVILIGAALAGSIRRGGIATSPCVDIVIAGACLVVLPAILQAPVAALNAASLKPDTAAVEAVMQSRLYYAGFAGLAMFVAGSADAIAAAGRWTRAAVVLALVLVAGAFGWTSHRTAAVFAAQTSASRALAETAAVAIERTASTDDERCEIVVLGVVPPPEWSIYVSMDSVAKALAVDVDRVGRCVVRADYPTFFNLMRGETLPIDATPFVPRIVDGRPVPWLRVGAMTSAYVDAPEAFDASAYAVTRFLRDDNGVFADVTDDVLAGRIEANVR
jgi:hypothetical protein